MKDEGSWNNMLILSFQYSLYFFVSITIFPRLKIVTYEDTKLCYIKMTVN